MAFKIEKEGNYYVAYDMEKTKSLGSINIETGAFAGDDRCMVALTNHRKAYLGKGSGVGKVMHKVSMIQIPENALLHGVVQQLNGREAFTDTDEELNEKIYHGDVFAAILGELEICKGTSLYPPQKVIDQLEELNEMVDSEYIQVTNI